ncbi:hypothetical protein NOCA2760001 [metagenome]|uniref:Uncharacterized protein n=1 Tax=metagenome TaxID=256318 RepID=A0A2P2CEL6_9ZZZZ
MPGELDFASLTATPLVIGVPSLGVSVAVLAPLRAVDGRECDRVLLGHGGHVLPLR